MSGPPPPYPGAEGGYPPANTAYAPDSKMGPGPPPAGNLPFSFFNFFFLLCMGADFWLYYIEFCSICHV